MSLGRASPAWSVKTIDGSSYRLSDLRIYLLSGVMKFGTQGVLASEATPFPFSISFSSSFSLSSSLGNSPPAPEAFEVVLAFLLAGAPFGEVGAMGGRFCD